VVVRPQNVFNTPTITGLPTYSVEGPTNNDRWRLSSSYVVCNARVCNVTHQGQHAAGQSCYVSLGRHLVKPENRRFLSLLNIKRENG